MLTPWTYHFFVFSWRGPLAIQSLGPGVADEWVSHTFVKIWRPSPGRWGNSKPICSMYGIFTYIWVIFRANVGKYSIHGANGKWGSFAILGSFVLEARKVMGIVEMGAVVLAASVFGAQHVEIGSAGGAMSESLFFFIYYFRLWQKGLEIKPLDCLEVLNPGPKI